ncbi:hypothetical protein C0989_006502 [Termitomyces sp. Mn162]|nr:hypothetical protein C0989_006502 [Termitomyces sp. Mn162]
MNPAWNADTLNVPQFPPGVLLGNIDFGHGTAEPLFPRVPRPTHSLHGLLPVVGHQLSAADKVFSWKVVHVLKKEMLEYIPLDQLTDEACHTAAHEPPVPESTFVMADGKLHLPNTSFNLSKEIKLTYKDWSAASDNLVDAMHKHLWAEGDNHSGGCIAQAIANSFAAHFKNLHNLPNARVEFDVVLDYDCHLHCMFLTNSHTFNMAHFHRDVWHKLSKYAKEIALGRVSPGYPPKVALALFGLHQSAPLNVIFSARGKLHITLDLSYPHNDPLVPSINSLINATHFKCDWSTFSACWLLVANAPEGTQVVVFDVDSAF